MFSTDRSDVFQQSFTSSHLPLRAIQLAFSAFLLFAGWMSVRAGMHYPGNGLVFAIFAVLANVLLLNGFRRGAIFFDTFIGIFFWLGFFLKLTIRMGYHDSRFNEPVGVFDGSGASWDRALIVISVAFAALMLASLLRERVFRYPAPPSCRDQPLYRFYCEYRKALLLAFAFLVAVVAISNAWFVFYQRGMATVTTLPFGLNGVYKWLLQFGLASGSALVVRFEIERVKGLNGTSIFVPLLESFVSNVAMLSRGMILNSAALGWGALSLLVALRSRLRGAYLLVGAVSFGLLFAGSVLGVNYLRTKPLYEAVIGTDPTGESSAEVARRTAIFRSEAATRMATPLFIDRWVGLEGVLAVSSSAKLGWDLWREAWRERYDEKELGLYDRYFIDSPYKEHGNKGVVHYVSLPGLVAFLFYPGSLPFLFVAVMGFALAAALLEYLCYRWCGYNWVLCSLCAQVVAFRFVSFGYVPAQSHLLFGSLVLNGLLIWGVNHLLVNRYGRPAPVSR